MMEQRDFTPAEILQLQAAGFATYENMGWLEREDVAGVQVFVTNTGVFIAHQEIATEIEFTTDLGDIIFAANNILAES